MKIVKITREDPLFFSLVGPFLARREVVRDVGAPIWDDDGKTWMVAIADLDDERECEIRIGEVMGFAAVQPMRGHNRWCSAWVRPECRRRGVWRALTAARDEAFPGPAVSTVCRELAPAMREFRFRKIGRRGRWLEMARRR